MPTTSTTSCGASASRSRARRAGRWPANSGWSCGKPARPPNASCHTGQARRSASATRAAQPLLAVGARAGHDRRPLGARRAARRAPRRRPGRRRWSAAAICGPIDLVRLAARAPSQSSIGTITIAGPAAASPPRGGRARSRPARPAPARAGGPHGVVAGQPVEPAGQERLEREVAAVLLADDDHQRRAVGRARWRARRPRCPARASSAAARARARRGRARSPPPCHHGALVQGEHEAQVLGQAGEERHLGRAGIGEDRRQLEPPQDVEGGVADGGGRAHAGKVLQNVWQISARRWRWRADPRTMPPWPRSVPARAAMCSDRDGGERADRDRDPPLARGAAAWQPGDRIGTEQEMADEFGVSRPTLREALRLLSASHLIRVGRGRSGGIFVARTPSEGMSRNVSESIALMLAAQSISMDELLDARLSLEVPLAGRAAVNADDDVAARLEEAIADADGHTPGTRAVQRRRHALPPDPRRGGGQRPAARAHRLDPRGAPAVAGRPHLASRSTPTRSSPSTARSCARCAATSASAAEKAMQAHIEYLVEVLQRSTGRGRAVAVGGRRASRRRGRGRAVAAGRVRVACDVNPPSASHRPRARRAPPSPRALPMRQSSAATAAGRPRPPRPSRALVAATPIRRSPDAPATQRTGTVSATPSTPYSPASTPRPARGPAPVHDRRDHPRHAVPGRPGRGAGRSRARRGGCTSRAGSPRRRPLRRGRATTASPATVMRSSSGTQWSPCSPSTQASTVAGATPSRSPTAVRTRRLSLAV